MASTAGHESGDPTSLGGQVLRGFGYLFALAPSVGIATVTILNAIAGSTVEPAAGTLVCLGLAAFLTNDANPPRMARLVVFSVGAFTVWLGLRTLLSGLVAVGSPGVLLVLWALAFGASAVVSYGWLWAAVHRLVRTEAPPGR